MKHLLFPIVAAAIAVAALQPTSAHAQRVFVAAAGSDGSPCSLTQPCRTFQHAFDTVAAGGEIDALDPAGYGTLTINHAISIQGHGYAGISVPSGGTGITINAGANDTVVLRGLIIEGAGVGANGVVFNAGHRLEVLDNVVRNFTSTGLFLQPTTNSRNLIADTRVLDVSNSTGIDIVPGASTLAFVELNRVTVSGNHLGVNIDSSAAFAGVGVGIFESTIGTSTNGLQVVGRNNITCDVSIKSTMIFASDTTAISVTNASLFLSNSTIANADTGIAVGTGATILTAGNNDFNNAPVSGTLTANPQR